MICRNTVPANFGWEQNIFRETEAKIFAALDAHKKGRAILAVTHGEHYLGYYDKVIHL